MATAGSLVINVGARTDAFSKSLAKARTDLQRFKASVMKIASVTKAGFAAFGIQMGIEKAIDLLSRGLELGAGIERIDRANAALERLNETRDRMLILWAESIAPRIEEEANSISRGALQLERAELRAREFFFSIRRDMGDQDAIQHLNDVQRRRLELDERIRAESQMTADALWEQSRAAKEMVKRLEILGAQYKKNLAFDEALRREFRTPQQEFADRMNELRAALRRGGIDQGTFDRASAAAQERFQSRTKLPEQKEAAFRAPEGAVRGTSAAIEAVARFQEESRSKLNEDQARQRQLAISEEQLRIAQQEATQQIPQIIGLLRTLTKQPGAAII